MTDAVTSFDPTTPRRPICRSANDFPIAVASSFEPVVRDQRGRIAAPCAMSAAYAQR